MNRPLIPAQKIPLLKEDNLLTHSFYKQQNWKNNETKSYYDTVKKVDNVSRFLINQSDVKQDWEQERENNTHTKALRVVDEEENRKHPTFAHPVVKPQDANLWYANGIIHTFASQYNFNDADYAK